MHLFTHCCVRTKIDPFSLPPCLFLSSNFLSSIPNSRKEKNLISSSLGDHIIKSMTEHYCLFSFSSPFPNLVDYNVQIERDGFSRLSIHIYRTSRGTIYWKYGTIEIDPVNIVSSTQLNQSRLRLLFLRKKKMHVFTCYKGESLHGRKRTGERRVKVNIST